MKIEMGVAEQNKGSEIELNKGSEIELPGFRFHPTEQELVGFYLKKMVQGKLHNFNFIGILDLYRYDPWDLPSLSRWGERELFFFVPRDKKCQNGGRPNRITACGYWKATGSDRYVRDEHGKPLGLKKTLVFYKGRAPRGQKTDWVMNEYRMPEAHEPPRREVVLCRIHRKATPLKWLEQRAMSQAAAAAAAAENSMDDDLDYKSQETSMVSSLETKPLNVKIERDEVKNFHHFEASSSMEDNTATHSDVTSSQGCYPVDSISELNQFMESTVYGGFIDPVFQAFGADEGKKNIEGFSSLMAMFNNSNNANVSYNFGGGFDSVFPEVEDPPKLNVPKLSLDFSCLSRSNNTQEKNPFIDLWSPSSLLCTPHSQEQS